MKTFVNLVASASVMIAAISPSAVQAREPWVTALVDSAGCLGLSAFGPLGCALGAAAASLAIANPGRDRDVVGNVWDPNGQGGCTEVNLPKSVGCIKGTAAIAPLPISNENVGYWHNRIVRAYMAENQTYKRDALLKIAIRELGLSRQLVRNPAIVDQLNKAISSGEEKAALYADCCVTGPHRDRDIAFQRDVIDLLSSAKTDRDIFVGIGKLEQRHSEAAKTEADRVEVRKYYTVLRSSMAYWRNAQSITFGNCMIEPARCGTLPILPKQ